LTTPNVWSTITLSPPALAWNTHSLIYGKVGYTAVSQLNSWNNPNSIGQVPVTALTGHHGYTSGHSLGGTTTNWYSTTNPLMTVYFCSPPSTVVTVNVLGVIVRADGVNDYSVLFFDSDVTAGGITPMCVGEPPQNPGVLLATQQAYDSAQYGCTVALASPNPYLWRISPPFPFAPWYEIGGDSGSPNMVPTTSGYLLFIKGSTTTGPGTQGNSQMQTDMNTLIGMAHTNGYPNLSTNNYQMQWYPTD